MVKGLAPSDLVKVSTFLEPVGPSLQNFGLPLLVGSTPGVVDVSERIRKYSNITQVLEDYPNTSGEYLAADVFFSQSPQPAITYIGYWAQYSTPGVLHGGRLTPKQQLYTYYNGVSSGALFCFVDGVPYSITGLNFTQQTALPGVAYILQTALAGSNTVTATFPAVGASLFTNAAWPAGFVNTANQAITFTTTGALPAPFQVGTVYYVLAAGLTPTAFQLAATPLGPPIPVTATGTGVQSVTAAAAFCTWNQTYDRFEISSGSSGTASSVGFFQPPTGWAGLSFSTQPANSDVLVINGTTVTFKTTLTTGIQCLIGGSLAATLNNLATLINANATTDVNFAKIEAFVNPAGTAIYFISKAFGTAGNSYTLAITTCTAATLLNAAGGTFHSGMAYTDDVSTMLGLSAAAGAYPPVSGVASESWLTCAALMASISNDWYALANVATIQPSAAEHEAVAEFIEACSPSRIYLVTIDDDYVLAPNLTTDLASQFQILKLSRTFTQYSSTNPWACVSMFGRQASVNYFGSNTVIDVMWKQEPGIAPEVITETQAMALQQKNCNVFVEYNNGTAIIQWGVGANGIHLDERVGIDWLANYVAVTLWDVLYQIPTKVPQTDAGTHLLTTPIAACCQTAVTNDLLAPGVWNGPPVGQINSGDILPLGYYVYAPIWASMSQLYRETRASVPIQVLCKFSGAVETVDVMLLFER